MSLNVNWTHEVVVNFGVSSLFRLSVIPRRFPAGGSMAFSLDLNKETRRAIAVGTWRDLDSQ